MEVASDGMPRSGRLGFELFDKLNWGQTEFDEKVNYQRALEGELERSIQTLRDVDSVRVHLVMSTDSVFLDRERPAKASVILKLRSGRLSGRNTNGHCAPGFRRSGQAKSRECNRYRCRHQPSDRQYRGTAPSSADGSLEQEYTARLLQTLEPVVGPDHVRASVNIEFDPSTSEENEEATIRRVLSRLLRTVRKSRSGAASTRRGARDKQYVPGGNGGAKPAAESGTARSSPGARATLLRSTR